MSEVDLTPRIKPKSESHTYEKQRYTVTFDLNALPERRWFWHVKYTRVYDIVGGAPTLNAANQQARRSIRELNKDVERGAT